MTIERRARSARSTRAVRHLAGRRIAIPQALVSALLLATLAACSAAPSPLATSTGAATTTPPTPMPSPTVAGLQHPTGPHDVVLRFEESGGFVPVEFLATSAPSFTLYGDGTVVFRDPTAAPPTSVDGIVRATPFLTVQLDEEAVQALLNEALGPGGLAIAKGPYMGMVADMPTSIFTISIGGATKQVSVMGLSPESHQQDKAIITAIAALAHRLNTFGGSVTGAKPYEPTAYRAILNPVDQAVGNVIDWPWTDLRADDFTSGVNEFLRTHVVTPAQVEAVGIRSIAGGMSGVSVRSNGKVFTLSIRPLLPDETS